MDKIQIIDNFLDHTELNVVKNILNNYDWKYGHTSGDKETFMSKFFANYEQEDIFMEYIKSTEDFSCDAVCTMISTVL